MLVRETKFDKRSEMAAVPLEVSKLFENMAQDRGNVIREKAQTNSEFSYTFLGLAGITKYHRLISLSEFQSMTK